MVFLRKHRLLRGVGVSGNGGGVGVRMPSSKVASRTTLLSTANMLSICLIPIIVQLYLDGACAARWILWWSPCAQKHAPIFQVDGEDPRIFRFLRISIIRHEQVCKQDAQQDHEGGMTNDMEFLAGAMHVLEVPMCDQQEFDLT